MKRVLAFALLMVIGLWPMPAAQAQAPAPEVIDGTMPISVELRTALEAYLEAYPPSAAPYYAPTYVQDQGAYVLVSLAGLDLQSADDPWRMESTEDQPSNVVWIGTVRIYPDGSGEMYSTQQTRNLPHLAAPDLGPGGGQYVHLPFTPGKSMMYGVRLIHGSGDYGTSGMYAVDLVGGDSLGTNVASSTVYASAAGEIDYVCADDVSVAVRTYNEATDDYFVYAHLLDNASLELETVFTSGQAIGALRYGTFDDSCGWAEQADSNYHIHLMFEPSGGAYKVGTYTVLLSDKKFHSGDKTYGAGDWIFNNYVHSGYDDPSGAGSYVPSIWDNIVSGIVVFITGTGNLLPAHNSTSAILRGVMNTVVLFFRLTWILLRGNLNLAPIAVIALFLIGVRIPFWTIKLIFWGIRVFRLLKQSIAF